MYFEFFPGPPIAIDEQLLYLSDYLITFNYVIELAFIFKLPNPKFLGLTNIVELN